ARPKALELASMLAQKAAAPDEPSGGAALAEAAERAQKAIEEPRAAPTPSAPAAHDWSVAPRAEREEPALSPTKSAASASSSSVAAIERTPSPAAASAFGPPPSAITPTMSMPLLTVREIPSREVSVVPT